MTPNQTRLYKSYMPKKQQPTANIVRISHDAYVALVTEQTERMKKTGTRPSLIELTDEAFRAAGLLKKKMSPHTAQR